MEQGWFDRLTVVMARLAAGDCTAMEGLYVGFGDPIRAAVRAELRALGLHRVDPDDVEGLVVDVVIDLAGRAASWDPSFGVTPWCWARRQLRVMVIAHLGLFADELPDGHLPEAAPPPAVREDDEEAITVLARLADRRPEVALLVEALGQVARPAQAETMLQVRLQADQGDPSSSHTVARSAGIKPDAVRQTTKRVLDRVRTLSGTDPRYAPLAGLALLRPAA